VLTYWEAESVALREWWSTRWYAPILALAGLRTGQWEGTIAVGDASRRLDASAEAEDEGIARARQAYLTALFVAQALRIAEQQAGRDPASRARVRAISDRWMKSPLEIDTRDPHLSGGHQP
jgi:hypothetical protein